MSPRTPAPHPLAALITAQRPAIVERLAREAIAGQTAQASPSERTYWATVPLEQLTTGILAALAAISRDLEGGTHEHYAHYLVTIAVLRARGGITKRSVRVALHSLAGTLRELCQQLSPTDQVEALEQVGLIIESAWAAAFDYHADAMRVAVEDAHLAVLRALSVPIIPIHAGILVLPLIGAIDVARGELLMATLLPAIAEEHAFGVLLDITGVPAIDAAVAGWLVRIAQAARLLGAEVILVGVSPQTAQTMVAAQLDLRGLVAFGTLQVGLEHLLARRGFGIQRRASGPGPA